MAGSSPEAVEEVVWRVLPLTTPRVLRHCPRCERTRAFASTEKFRLNAQQRNIDVWLLYDCVECGTTWKREIMARTSPEEIGADLYERFLRNDAATAQRYAFDVAGMLLEGDGGPRFAGPGRAEARPSSDLCVIRAETAIAPPLRIRLDVPFTCATRLDRLLATELGVSRDGLRKAVEGGRIAIEPGGERALRRPPRDGTVIVVT